MVLAQQLTKVRVRAKLRPHGELRTPSSISAAPRCGRPSLPILQSNGVGVVVRTGTGELTAKPFGHAYGYGIAYELPAWALPAASIGDRSPAAGKALERLGVLERWRDEPHADGRVWNPDPRGGRYPDRGATLECRCCVMGPTQTTQAFGPVETEGVVSVPSRARLSRVIGQQDGSRVVSRAGDEQHSLPSLRNPNEP